jgi:SAM-dependent methyltransferase
MAAAKRNVAAFGRDVEANAGYRYTTNAPYSSIVANARMTEAIAAALPPGATDVVDIGCGDGTYTGELKARFPGVRFTGLEPAAAAVEAARRKHPEVEFAVFDLMDPATFPARRFHAGILRGVVHHLPDGAIGIAHAARLADRIIIVEPNGNNPVLKWIERNSRYHIEHEEQSFTDRRLRQWCEAAGLKVARLGYFGFVPFFFPTPLARLIHFFQPLLEAIPPLRKWLGGQIILVCERA